MRIPNPFFALLATGKKGAVMENDGELVVPSVYSNSGLIPSPLALINPGATNERSGSEVLAEQLVGANGTSQLNGSLWGPGVYAIDWALTYTFTGVVDALVSAVNIESPANTPVGVIHQIFKVTGSQSASGRFFLHMLGNWRFIVSHAS